VTSFNVRRQFVDGDTVCSIVDWEMAIPGVGRMTAAELLEVKDGIIVRGELIYDGEELRRAMAHDAPASQWEHSPVSEQAGEGPAGAHVEHVDGAGIERGGDRGPVWADAGVAGHALQRCDRPGGRTETTRLRPKATPTRAAAPPTALI
jgi:hypothetical protein